jgi:2-oxoglutarate ferredoxin oxidoreductase subunit gamma
MTEEIIIAGFGGQGVLLAGKLLCVAAMRQGREVSHIPSYGAEMRGGTANCSVVISDEDIASPVIERPGVVIALNGPSLAKFEDRLRPGGLLIWNSSLVKNPPTRKDLVQVPIEATALSLAEGTERGANMAAIGALLELKPDLVGLVAVEEALDEVISARNKKHNPVNIRILHAGQSAVGGNVA